MGLQRPGRDAGAIAPDLGQKLCPRHHTAIGGGETSDSGNGSGDSACVVMAGVVESSSCAVRSLTFRFSAAAEPVRASVGRGGRFKFEELAAVSGFAPVDGERFDAAAAFVFPEIGAEGGATLAALLAAARRKLGSV